MILNCFEESPRDCFNFALSDERSTFTLFTKLKVLQSAPISKLNMGVFLNYHYYYFRPLLT